MYCAGEPADRDEPLDAGQAARGPGAQGHGPGDRQGLPRDAQRRHRHQGIYKEREKNQKNHIVIGVCFV